MGLPDYDVVSPIIGIGEGQGDFHQMICLMVISLSDLLKAERKFIRRRISWIMPGMFAGVCIYRCSV